MIALSSTPTTTSFTASSPMTLLKTSCIYVGLGICNDSVTCTRSNQISNILFQMPVSNGNYGALLNYLNQDRELYKVMNIQSTIYNVNVNLYDDNINNLNLLPSAKVLLELSFNYNEQITKKEITKIIY